MSGTPSDPGAQGVAASKPWHEAISGWRPNFRPPAVQFRYQQAELLALIGRRLMAGWTGWHLEREKWNPGSPLVLVFDDGVQLELAWESHAVDHVSITWNTIDLTAPPEITGSPHEWRSSHPAPVAAIAGRTLTGFATIETPYFRGEDADFTNGLPMHAVAGWDIDGLWIEFGDRGLQVYSGADSTWLSADPVRPGYETATRLTRWSSP
ncbi:hypothetical protein [Dactylosporangium darangshiense]|uniref:DUF4178 domain-containing protein n=1 Tax=Dactylosporangium darangshiense TaxID=579108 RepID=A0ABP8DLV0_9ACTN